MEPVPCTLLVPLSGTAFRAHHVAPGPAGGGGATGQATTTRPALVLRDATQLVHDTASVAESQLDELPTGPEAKAKALQERAARAEARKEEKSKRIKVAWGFLPRKCAAGRWCHGAYHSGQFGILWVAWGHPKRYNDKESYHCIVWVWLWVRFCSWKVHFGCHLGSSAIDIVYG